MGLIMSKTDMIPKNGIKIIQVKWIEYNYSRTPEEAEKAQFMKIQCGCCANYDDCCVTLTDISPKMRV